MTVVWIALGIVFSLFVGLALAAQGVRALAAEDDESDDPAA